MPFDLNNPKPPEIYETPHGRRRRYWPYPDSIENLAYTPKEIRSWRSVPYVPGTANVLEVSKCEGKCVDQPMLPYYPENYLHEKIMLENPTILAALKNTTIIRSVPDTPIQLVPPHFLHKSKRSRFHLVVPQTYRAALCKITDNLYNYSESQKQVLVTRKRRGLAKDRFSFPNKPDSPVARDGHKSPANESIAYIAKSEGLLNYVRRKVEEDIEIQELKKLDKRFFSSVVEFDKNVQTSLMGRYGWDKKGVESLCVNYPGLSMFNESPSEIAPSLKASEEIVDNNLFQSTKKVLRKIPADMMKLFLNAPSSKVSYTSNPEQLSQFSHNGLLETAKSDALETFLKKLYRREREVKIPLQLMNNTYGPLKGMPKGYKFQAPHLPENLEKDYPPQPEELKKVERVMKNEKKERRNRKARGVQSEEPVSRVIGQFSKPIIESSENESTTIYRKSIMTLDDYPIKYNELNKRDSSDSLFCDVGAVKMEQENEEALHPVNIRHRRPTWMLEIMAKSSAALEQHKALWRDQLQPGRAQLRTLTTVSDMSSSSPSTDEEDEEMNSQEGLLIEMEDSRELLPYPDVKFSAIRVPSDAIDVADTWLYRKLNEDQRSLSSSDSQRDLEDDGGQEDDEEEEERRSIVKEEKSEASVELDKIFKNIQPLLTRSKLMTPK